MNKNIYESENPAGKTLSAPKPRRPDFIPGKFWDLEKGEVQLENLARSYVAMEKNFSAEGFSPVLSANEDERQKFFQAVGVPKTADEYEIEVAASFLRNDPHINRLLHKANFTQAQVQLVYDLAAVELMPLIQHVSDHFDAATSNARLESHFGGRDKWREISRQIRKWGESHLPADAYDAMAASVEGIKAMHKMMGQGEEPSMLKGGIAADGPTEEGLRKLMNDPRYWRDKDPSVVSKVTEGFKRLYPS